MEISGVQAFESGVVGIHFGVIGGVGKVLPLMRQYFLWGFCPGEGTTISS